MIFPLLVVKQLSNENMSSHLDKSKDAHLKMTASKCKELEDKLTKALLAIAKLAPRPVFTPPPDVAMNEYERRRMEEEDWFSLAFYTHVGGYKMCLNIDPNGRHGKKGTHVGVGVYMIKGEFDSHLKWPFKGEIIVELVNQKEGGVNYEGKPIYATLSEEAFQRVTDGEISEVGWGIAQFISQVDLYKPEEGKEYLLNDTLIFRVTKLEVTSI